MEATCAKEIRSSYQWNEVNIYTPKKAPPDDQRTTIYKVLTLGEAQEVPIGTSDVSKVEIKAHLQKRSSDSKKTLSTLCLFLGNICAEGKVNVSSIVRKKKNLEDINYIEVEVTDQYKTLARQLKARNIDFYLKLTVAGKFVVIGWYTISLRLTKKSSWDNSYQTMNNIIARFAVVIVAVLQLLGRRYLLTTTELRMNTALDTLPVTGVEITV